MIRLFSFGYAGWGNATAELVRAVDAVERRRGWRPPLFVDIRIRRTVRAEGFQGRNFERLIGPARHRWMPSLGNLQILSRRGPRVQIAEPAAAAELLELALRAAAERRQVIFFCSCAWPVRCHRAAVARLLLAAARRAGVPLQVREWPGGEPTELVRRVSQAELAALLAGKRTLPVGPGPPRAEHAGLAWGSTVCVHAGGGAWRFYSGPARYHSGQWRLPVFSNLTELRRNLGRWAECG